MAEHEIADPNEYAEEDQRTLSQVTKIDVAETRLRFAALAFLNESSGDIDWLMDIVELAVHDWGKVNVY